MGILSYSKTLKLPFVSFCSGLYSLFRSSAVDLHGARLHAHLTIQKPNSSEKVRLNLSTYFLKNNLNRQNNDDVSCFEKVKIIAKITFLTFLTLQDWGDKHNEVDDDILSTEASVSQDKKHSISIESLAEDGNDHNNDIQPSASSEDNEDDVVTAHVIVQQALHLTCVKNRQNERFCNVIVSILLHIQYGPCPLL